MIKRYIWFCVMGEHKGEGGKISASERGVCDARLDPLQVALKRNGKLAMCDQFKIKWGPAFAVPVEGSRRKNKSDLQTAKALRMALDMEALEAKQKTHVFWDGPRRGGRRPHRGKNA